ncbi:hypothetical protein TWF225_010582 [Orbilia oligospora]|nr:hypothetical protein TWF225_010582 [Orbilia oligospora]KAF3250979.1 hypothetical protein TWF128_007404 [Orbilia oligospora]KAF3259093.1 hypothetical protein TWF217_005238 [Orbilia oligospora]KAF3291939.1 hypothetical protein TWF132_006444 [Orbilia oligospora]
MADNGAALGTPAAEAHDRSRSHAWYKPGEKLKLSPYTLELFQNYSRIPADQVAAHIIEVRQKAWEVYPYPCIGSFRFLDFAITESPIFTTALTKLNSGGKYLDLGCCFAQDLRALVHAGIPSENLYGADLQSGFIDLSYDLFKDGHTLKSTFFEGDIFDFSTFKPIRGEISNPNLFQKIKGDIDIISARSFLHLFNPEREFKAACQIVAILKDSPGSIIMGRQVGSFTPGMESISLGRREVFRHDPQTWEELWNRVGEATDTKWDVQAKLLELSPDVKDSIKAAELANIETRGWLEFVITRL